MPNIEIVKTDITQLAVDAIVNAANSSLLGGGGVDGAIHKAAGPELLAHCRALGGCATGEAKITPGFALPAKYVIHTVGPVWQGGQHGEPALLRSCYEHCLQLAERHGIDSLAFPAISTGVYGYPKESACTIAVACVSEWQDVHPKQVLFTCFDEHTFALYKNALRANTSVRPPTPGR